MNGLADNNQAQKGPSKGFWWSLFILFVLLPAMILVSAKATTSNSLATKTEVIINSIRTGIELSVGGNREMIPLEFSSLRKQFADLPVMADLRALRAIDETRGCFVDAWGRPLVIRPSPNHSYEVISSGRDGLLGTADDLR